MEGTENEIIQEKTSENHSQNQTKIESSNV